MQRWDGEILFLQFVNFRHSIINLSDHPTIINMRLVLVNCGMDKNSPLLTVFKRQQNTISHLDCFAHERISVSSSDRLHAKYESQSQQQQASSQGNQYCCSNVGVYTICFLLRPIWRHATTPSSRPAVLIQKSSSHSHVWFQLWRQIILHLILHWEIELL